MNEHSFYNRNKILIVGSGGREHAIGWKLKQSPKVSELFFAPGNGGTSLIGTNLDFKVLDNEGIAKWAKRNKIDLVVVGPDDPLANGMVDYLNKFGIKAFGPSKLSAEIESSKVFAKKLMQEENIPTAKFKTFTNFKNAVEYLKQQNFPIVLKASGLALGKGVIIAKSVEEGVKGLADIMVKKIFEDAGSEVVIEEFLEGQEISIHVFCDGKNYSIFPSSQDHKAIFDGDKGPNTGGMGTIAPVGWVSDELMDRIEKEIVIPTLAGLKKRGREFKGILYPGVMVTNKGPKVLEFNARFGDPEVESYLRLLKTDLFDIFMACIDGTLNELNIEWEKKFACCIVLASGGYPGSYEKGKEISGINEAEKIDEVVVFHAGTKAEKGKLLTNGGRVLGISATGNNLDQALEKVYQAIKKVNFEGMQYRLDIGKRKPFTV
ncbi:phosphoribosylamine--glycine ligase [Candidatus Daviesbacteria bacterium]|nr:phosphoribosylamine--glycine ligase [Candidatus Daviesbacteria bacterium]